MVEPELPGELLHLLQLRRSRGRAELRARGHQDLHDELVAARDRVLEGRGLPAVDRRVMSQRRADQETDGRQLAFGRGQVHRRPSVVVPLVHVHVALEKLPQRRQVPVRGRGAEQLGGHLVPHLAAALVQVPHDHGEAVADGVLQRRGAPSVLGVDVGLARGQERDDRQVALRGGQVHRRARIVVDGVEVDAEVDQLLHLDRVALRGVPAELRRGVVEHELAPVAPH
mmetsp:Transcript_28710/g.86826  ORF Transcript_28710/g.86826 Transcript_28710/m.86826 type:complete len:227 (+) Transcript_28710:531-1211(+)